MGNMIDQKNITMPCKVGITTTPVNKTLEWKIKYPELTNWKILGNELSYFDAKSLVEFYATQFGCEASGVNETKEDPVVPWYVYYFEF
jgi:hypothetical protein